MGCYGGKVGLGVGGSSMVRVVSYEAGVVDSSAKGEEMHKFRDAAEASSVLKKIEVVMGTKTWRSKYQSTSSSPVQEAEPGTDSRSPGIAGGRTRAL